jgi:signal transduction histidine kinase
LLALVPVLALGAVLGHELSVDVQQRYLDTSISSATLITRVGIQPLLNSQELSGGLSPAELDQIDQRLQGANLSQQVRRIKVWNLAGTIIYSDNRALVGRTFPIDADLAEALGGDSTGSITDGHDEENAGDDLAGPLIQVYAPLRFNGTAEPSGAFELYLPYAPVQAAIDRESMQLYIYLAAGLTLFYAAMFPVALIADRWRRRLLREAETTAIANLAVLERLNRLKSEFLTRISHQFRTALVGIQGFSEVIRDSDDLDLAKVKSFAADIYDDAEQLNRAFSEMLELDRMEAGHAILDVGPVDLNQLIRQSVETARANARGHVLRTGLDPSLTAVLCDAEKVSHVLGILLANAVKYSPAGTEVTVTSHAEADDVTVTVQDQGPGMPAGFGNGRAGAHPVDGDVAARTGLGLAVARQIIDMHGGVLWFDSSAGAGSEFHFTLPLAAEGSGRTAAAPAPEFP